MLQILRSVSTLPKCPSAQRQQLKITETRIAERKEDSATNSRVLT